MRLRYFATLTLIVLFSSGDYCFAAPNEKDSTKSKLVVKGGVDILSNFIWRGVALDPYPCIQPALQIGSKNIEFGMLGSYSLGGTFNATPLYLKYNIRTKIGNISPMLFDYYYPFKKIPFDNFDNTNGAHTLEASVTFKGNKIPLKVFLSSNIRNDSRNSTYLETSYVFKVQQQYGLEVFCGGSLTENSTWLGATDVGVSNIGITALRKFTITKDYLIPVSISYSVHTQLHYSYLSAKISFSL